MSNCKVLSMWKRQIGKFELMSKWCLCEFGSFESDSDNSALFLQHITLSVYCTLLYCLLSQKAQRCYSSSNKHIKTKAFSLRLPSLSQALSHDAPLFANKRGQPIEVTRLKLVVPLVLFSIWKAAHTLTDHLASAVMTEANTCSIQNSTNRRGNRLGKESSSTKTASLCFFPMWMCGLQGEVHKTFLFRQYTCLCDFNCVCSNFKV